METLLDKIEEIRLLNIASERIKITKQIKDFEDVISEFGFSKEEIFEDAESVEIEWYYTMNMTIIFWNIEQTVKGLLFSWHNLTIYAIIQLRKRVCGYSDTFYRMGVSVMDLDLFIKMIILLITLEIIRYIKK